MSAEWSAGAYIASTPPNEEEIRAAVDVQLRRMASFYTRYAPEVVGQRHLIDDGEIALTEYRDFVSKRKLGNAIARQGGIDEIGGRFDVLYGLGEVESRENIPPGGTLVISPTEQYNGCDGWYSFPMVLTPPFITVARTGSIGETFVHIEPCAPNSDCLILLPRSEEWASVAELILAAAAIRSERWRYNYGRKITPDRIASVRVDHSDETGNYAADLWEKFKIVIAASLAPYQEGEMPDSKFNRTAFNEIERDSVSQPDVESVMRQVLEYPAKPEAGSENREPTKAEIRQRWKLTRGD